MTSIQNNYSGVDTREENLRKIMKCQTNGWEKRAKPKLFGWLGFKV